MADTREMLPSDFDPDADRYPSLDRVIQALKDDVDIPDGPVERVEMTFLASGEATYRVWTARAEEPAGGYLPPQS